VDEMIISIYHQNEEVQNWFTDGEFPKDFTLVFRGEFDDLNDAWERTQNIHAPWNVAKPTRSSMVGDVFVTDTIHLVRNDGFRTLEGTMIDCSHCGHPRRVYSPDWDVIICEECDGITNNTVCPHLVDEVVMVACNDGDLYRRHQVWGDTLDVAKVATQLLIEARIAELKDRLNCPAQLKAVANALENTSTYGEE